MLSTKNIETLNWIYLHFNQIQKIQFLQILNKAFSSYDWSIGGSGAMVAEYIHGDGGVDAK